MGTVQRLQGLVRRWIGPWDRMQRAVMIEIDATVSMNGEPDRLTASIAGNLALGLPRERPRSAVETSRRWRLARLPVREAFTAQGSSEQAFRGTQPLVWIQLFDDQGASMTEEVLLGRGVETSRAIHARTALRMVDPVSNEGPITADRRARERQATLRGLWARLELRTFAVAEGPSFQSDQVWVEMLPAGFRLPEIALFWVAPPGGASGLAPASPPTPGLRSTGGASSSPGGRLGGQGAVEET